jgi:hypothetical protein
MPTDKIRALDMRLIDDLFGMGGGYVIDFSDRTFAEFFSHELDIDIDHPQFSVEGTSKAKRLRYFLKISDSSTRVRVLRAMWEYRCAQQRRKPVEEKAPDAQSEFDRLIARLSGSTGASAKVNDTHNPVIQVVDPYVLTDLKSRLIKISDFAPQPRGYEFERFLKALFDASGLGARAAFRLVGEQIDGSFQLSGETYLLEAKWRDLRIGASDLRSFNAKLEDKAAWTRGLFVSNSGFTDDGLEAFGRGKRVVCMDGLDLYETLDRLLSLEDVIARKVRRAAESGQPFVRVRDLYP